MLKIINVILFSFVLMLSFSCIFQVIKITEEKALAHQYQREINQANKEKSFADIDNNVFISLKDIEEEAREKSFVESSDVDYVEVSEAEMVIK